MTFWVPFWKFVFLAGTALFALVTVWVAVVGLGDIRRMLSKLSAKNSPKRGVKKRT